MILVAICVFSLFHPRELVVRPWRGHPSSLAGMRRVRVSDADLPFTASGEFVLAVPGKIERRFHGELQIRAVDGELRAIVRMDLETAVASVVAAESPPGAPMEALRAQAVAARSFFAASHGRHQGFDFCDTTHCQFLRQPPDLRERAWRAAESTHGLTLQYNGKTIPALYSADCGGHTDSLAGDQGGGYPYTGVECPRHSGLRRGHGWGLCQVGAAAMAASGAGFERILAFYYPGTSVH